MFAGRFFGTRFFCARFWAKVGLTPTGIFVRRPHFGKAGSRRPGHY